MFGSLKYTAIDEKKSEVWEMYIYPIAIITNYFIVTTYNNGVMKIVVITPH